MLIYNKDDDDGGDGGDLAFSFKTLATRLPIWIGLISVLFVVWCASRRTE